MNQRLHSSFCAIAALLTCSVTFSQEVAKDAVSTAVDEKINAILSAGRASEVAERFKKLFEAAGVQSLSELTKSPHDSIALQAAWEEVVMDIPEKINDDHLPFHPDVGKMNWFIGFLEGRARIRVPQWWINAALNAQANDRRNVYFPHESSEPDTPKESSLTILAKSGGERLMFLLTFKTIRFSFSNAAESELFMWKHFE